MFERIRTVDDGDETIDLFCNRWYKSHQQVQKSICLKCVCIYRAVNTSSRFLSFIITLSFHTLHYELPFPKIAFIV